MVNICLSMSYVYQQVHYIAIILFILNTVAGNNGNNQEFTNNKINPLVQHNPGLSEIRIVHLTGPVDTNIVMK